MTFAFGGWDQLPTVPLHGRMTRADDHHRRMRAIGGRQPYDCGRRADGCGHQGRDKKNSAKPFRHETLLGEGPSAPNKAKVQ